MSNSASKRRWRQANPQAVCEQTRRYRDAAQAKVLAHYSPYTPPRCACCGTTENLAIDHIAGNGRQHRLELFGNANPGWRFRIWLIKNNYPPGYQVLCKRCNSSKGNGERCRLDHAGMAR